MEGNAVEQVQKPDNLEKYTDKDLLFKKYEELVTEAASILICNYSSLNMAIEMGFSGSNKKFKAEGVSKKDMEMLQSTCGHFLTRDDSNDTSRRLLIIS